MSNQSLEKVFLLGNVDGADHGRAEHLLPLVHNIFEEVDCDVVVRRQVDAHVCRQEVIDLALATVLSIELLGRDSNQLLWLSWRDLLHLLIAVLHYWRFFILNYSWKTYISIVII